MFDRGYTRDKQLVFDACSIVGACICEESVVDEPGVVCLGGIVHAVPAWAKRLTLANLAAPAVNPSILPTSLSTLFVLNSSVAALPRPDAPLPALARITFQVRCECGESVGGGMARPNLPNTQNLASEK